ncbi:hypothetical protein FRC03_010311 [Tulasnella sp. 419]|nr:hypothetical protein FRC03_010311 [Tulasnella sp. 419]
MTLALPVVKWLIAGGVGLGVLNIFVQNQNLAYQNINYTATMEVDPVNRGFSDQYLQVIIDWLKTEPRNEEEGETIMKWVRESPNVIQAEIDVAQAAWNERKKKLGEQQNLAPRSHVSSPAINNNLD